MKLNIFFLMRFQIKFYSTAFYRAVERKNIEIIKLLLMNDKLDINIPWILDDLFIEFEILLFNRIHNYDLIKSIMYFNEIHILYL